VTVTSHTRPAIETHPRRLDGHPSTGELVNRATEQLSRLLRQEVALAKAELTEKGKRTGRGGGLLVAAAGARRDRPATARRTHRTQSYVLAGPTVHRASSDSVRQVPGVRPLTR